MKSCRGCPCHCEIVHFHNSKCWYLYGNKNKDEGFILTVFCFCFFVFLKFVFCILVRQREDGTFWCEFVLATDCCGCFLAGETSDTKLHKATFCLLMWSCRELHGALMFLQHQLKAWSLAGPEARACGCLNILLPVKAIYNVPVPGLLSAVSNLHLREHFGAMDGWLVDKTLTSTCSPLVLHT